MQARDWLADPLLTGRLKTRQETWRSVGFIEKLCGYSDMTTRRNKKIKRLRRGSALDDMTTRYRTASLLFTDGRQPIRGADTPRMQQPIRDR